MLANTWTLATIPAHRTVNTSTVNTSTRERLVELRLRNGQPPQSQRTPRRQTPPGPTGAPLRTPSRRPQTPRHRPQNLTPSHLDQQSFAVEITRDLYSDTHLFHARRSHFHSEPLKPRYTHANIRSAQTFTEFPAPMNPNIEGQSPRTRTCHPPHRQHKSQRPRKPRPNAIVDINSYYQTGSAIQV